MKLDFNFDGKNFAEKMVATGKIEFSDGAGRI
mgnify:CR=1 FL=1